MLFFNIDECFLVHLIWTFFFINIHGIHYISSFLVVMDVIFRDVNSQMIFSSFFLKIMQNSAEKPIGIILQEVKDYIKENPRCLGYRTSEETKKDIDNLKKFGIWQILHKDEIIPSFPQIAELFDVRIKSLRNWHNSLRI